MKKLFALLLALTLALSLGAMAFADGETAPTPMISVNDNHQYSVYQIFTGDLYEGILSNIKWGENGQGTKGNAVSDEDLNALIELLDSADAAIVDKIKTKYADFNGTAVGTVTKSAPLSGIPTGYYILVDEGVLKVNDDQTTTLDPAAEKSIHIVQVVGPTTIMSKAGVPEVKKEILDPTPVKANEASIGEDVQYKITGTMPTNLADYKEYYYVFTDTLSKGLTFKDDSTTDAAKNLKVMLYASAEDNTGVDVTTYFYKGTTAGTDANGNATTVLTVGIKNLLAFNNVEGIEVTSASTVVLTYYATVNENAEIGKNPNTNEVVLDYSNNPNKSGDGTPDTPPEDPEKPTPGEDHPTGETPKDDVKTYVTELSIQKVDGEGKPLTGAEFTLTGANVIKVKVSTKETFTEDDDGEYWLLNNGKYTKDAPHGDILAEDEETVVTKSNESDYKSTTQKYKKNMTSTLIEETETGGAVKGTVSNNGIVTFTGLGAGEYTLTETKTPAGYNTIAPITFKIDFDASDKEFSSDNDAIKLDAANNVFDAEIVNQSGTVLPETGGIGTTIFYVVGAVLVAGAAIVLFAKKRAEE